MTTVLHRAHTWPALVGAALAAAVVLAGCGDDGTFENGLGAAAQRGRQLAQDRGCSNCHTANGDPSTGPTWLGIWGTEVTLDDNRTVTVDHDYVARSVRDPQADIVDGFGPVMPSFELTDDEIDDLVAYLQALGGDGARSDDPLATDQED